MPSAALAFPRPDVEHPVVRAAAPAPRLLSIDVLRGLDVLLMLFVNEMADVDGTPAFLLHTPRQTDGMTITDVVFPAFLFITGMAIPLALGARMARGESRAAIWWHVLVRSVSLIVLGVFMVNAEQGAAPGLLSPEVWNILVTLGVLVVWHRSSGEDRAWPPARVAGVALLVALAFLYRSTDAAGVLQLRPHWWGILGLIGWAYLVAGGAFLLIGRRPWWLLAASAGLYGLYFLDQTGTVAVFNAAEPVMEVGEVLGSHAALVLSGAAALCWFVRAGEDLGVLSKAAQLVIFGAALIACGLAIHRFKDVGEAFWISKPMATPAWCLISGGATAMAWAALVVLVEGREWRRWPSAVTIAGQQALLCYVLAPLLGSCLALTAPFFGGDNPYVALGGDLVTGTVRSIVFAWIVVRLAGWLRSRGLRLQL